MRIRSGAYIIFCCILLACLPARADLFEDPLRVGLKIGSPPYTFVDRHDDKVSVRGLSPDLARLIGKVMGRRVEFWKSEDLAERRELLLQGRIDMIMFDSPSLQGNKDFIYIPTSVSLTRRLFAHQSSRDVVCLKDLGGKRVVIVAGDDPWQERDDRPANVQVVPTPLEALTLVENAKADVYVAPSEEVAEAFIQRLGFHNIRKVGIALERIPLCITVRKEDQELAAALTVALKRVQDSGALDKLKEKWFGIDFTPPTWERYRDEIAWTLSVIVAILLGIVVWNWLLKRKVRQVTRGLQSSERNFRNVIDCSPDMIMVVDCKGRIQRCNPKAAQALGIRTEESVGMAFADALPAVERERGLAFLAEVFEKGHATAGFHLHGARGTLRDIDVAATRVSDHETGEPLACSFARDMTERNRMEQELVQADRLATIGKMAASVAHEINNPLGIIQANVELLLARNIPPEETREHLEAIRRHTVRAGHITRDLLATARPKSPQMAQVNLEEMTLATLSMSAPHFKGITIEHHPSIKPALAWGDAGLLQQVLINLLLNAKAALNGRPDQRIDIRYCWPAGGGVRLSVLDNGKGIAREHLPEIFEPFYTAGKPEGFGLGLFISRRIVEHHGGVIYVESEAGQGTKMIIELPASTEPEAGAADAA
jgi:PAS domain S-box-containing protein